MTYYVFFFFQAEDGIRDGTVTGVQTCALPISERRLLRFTRMKRDVWPQVKHYEGGGVRLAAMRSLSLLCVLTALSCHTGSSNTAAGAVIMTTLALGSSAASRASGGCWAVCQQGERCNEKTGLC